MEGATPVYYKNNGEKNTFPNYIVTKEGKVYSKNYNHTMEVKECTGYYDKNGYIRLCMRDSEGKPHVVGRARLVLSTFNPPQSYSLQVNHISEKKDEDSLDNLEWVTSKDNSNWGTRNQRIKEKMSGRKHTYRYRPVKVYKYLGQYDNIENAIKDLGLPKGSVCNVSSILNGSTTQKLVHGYYFEDAEIK